jgi:hypothetical protein
VARFKYKVVVGGVVHEPELSSQTKQHMGGRRKKEQVANEWGNGSKSLR